MLRKVPLYYLNFGSNDRFKNHPLNKKVGGQYTNEEYIPYIRRYKYYLSSGYSNTREMNSPI